MFIYTVFVFYNLYIYIVQLSLIIIYSPRFCCCYFTSFFTMKNYICPKKKQCYLFVIYHVSISHLQAVNCIPWAVKNLLVSVKSLSQMFMSHIRKCMFRLCVYLLGIYINHFMYIHLFFFTAIITDQRMFSHWFEHCKWCRNEMEKKKESQLCFFSHTYMNWF